MWLTFLHCSLQPLLPKDDYAQMFGLTPARITSQQIRPAKPGERSSIRVRQTSPSSRNAATPTTTTPSRARVSQGQILSNNRYMMRVEIKI